LLILSLVCLTGCGGGRPAAAADSTATAVPALSAPAATLTKTVQPPMIFFVTPPPVRAEEPLSPDSRNIPSVFPGVDTYYDIQAELQVEMLPLPPLSSLQEVAKSVVQIYRCNNGNCDTPVGSGVLIHPSGVIATAYHTLLRNPENPNSGPFDDVATDTDNTVIAMTVDVGSIATPRFQARLAATKIDQDLALLQIDRDLQGNPIAPDDLNLPALPLADVTNLFDQEFRVLGYPTSGGEPISIDRTNFRRYDDSRSLIIVDRPLEPGNSGGPVLFAQSEGFAVAGIVIRRRTTQGRLDPEGLVRTIDQLQKLIWTPSVTRAWGEGVIARFDDDAVLQLGLSIHTFDLRNQPLRLLFYATEAATDQPWRPVGMNGPLVVWADVEPRQVIARQTLTLTVPIESLGAMPDLLRFRALLWNRDEGATLWTDAAGMQAVQSVNTATPTVTPEPTATATPQPTPTPFPTATATMTDTPLPPTPTFTDTPAPEPTPPPTVTATATDTPLPPTFTATPVPQPPRITANANLRSGPGTNYSITGGTVTGQVITIVARNEDASWFQLANGGWVAAFLVANAPKVDDVPLFAASAETTDSTPRSAAIGTATPTYDPLLAYNITTLVELAPNELMRLGRGSTNEVAYSPDGQILAVASSLGVWLYYVARPDYGRLLLHRSSVNSVSWSPNGSQVASGSSDNTVRIWDVGSGETLATLPGYMSSVRSVSWSPDGSKLASGAVDGTVRIWDVGSGEMLTTLEGHTGSVRSVNWSPDGSKLASGSSDNTMRIWDVWSGETLTTLEGYTGSVNSVSWSPNGSQVAYGVYDHTVRIWDAESGEMLTTLEGHTSYVNSVSWSPNDSQVASASDDGTVRIWDVGSGEALATLGDQMYIVWSVSWSPDGSLVASASGDNTVSIWDVGSGETLVTLEGHTRPVRSVNWSPDGSLVASASDDGTMRIWDVGSGETLVTLPGDMLNVGNPSWSSDGNKIVYESDDGTMRIWDAESGEASAILQGHTSYVWSVSWSPDGSKLASASIDGTVRIWRVD